MFAHYTHAFLLIYLDYFAA